MTLNCPHILVLVGSSLLQKRINQQHQDHWVVTSFRVLSLPQTIFTTIFYEGKAFFYQVIIMNNFFVLEICQVSGIDKTLIPGSKKLITIIYRVPFTVHLFVGIIHNGTTSQEQKKIDLVYIFKKKMSTLVLSLPEWKKWEKRFMIFCFCPMIIFL